MRERALLLTRIEEGSKSGGSRMASSFGNENGQVHIRYFVFRGYLESNSTGRIIQIGAMGNAGVIMEEGK